jgi:hypothetical protein
MVSERKTRDEVLQLVRDGRSRLDAALAGAPEDEATKAMLAHVMHWEQVMVQRLGGTSPPVGWLGEINRTNAAVAAHHSSRPFADVRREFEAVHRDLFRRIEALSDDELNRETRPGGETVWRKIAGETWGHYPEHVAQLEARARTSGKG